MSGTPVVKAPTIEMKVGEQKDLTPRWKNTQGEEIELDHPDYLGNEVNWVVAPHSIVELEPQSGGVTAKATAVGIGSCTVVATAVTGLTSAEMHINVTSDGPVSGEIDVR